MNKIHSIIDMVELHDEHVQLITFDNMLIDVTTDTKIFANDLTIVNKSQTYQLVTNETLFISVTNTYIINILNEMGVENA